MRLLKRLLRGPHERRPRHLDSCAECRLQQRRERQYLERLRGAEVPVASDDLTARLLARTAELARNERLPSPPAAARDFRPALRSAVLVAGTAAAATALLGGSAYLMGGDRAPTAAGAPAAVFLQRELARLRGCCRRRDRGRGAGRVEPHRRTRFHPGRSPHGRAARLPCAPRAGPAPNSANSATTSSGPGQGCSPAATSWSCGSPTAGTSPPSWNSTVAADSASKTVPSKTAACVSTVCPGSPAVRAAGRNDPRRHRSTC